MNTYKNININNANIINTTGIQSGDNTHHQDHVITLHSLSTINATVKRVVNPPNLTVTVSLIIYYI